MAQENISGVVPLYLNERHWSIAKLFMDRACAQLICKNPLAGTFEHKMAAVLLAYDWSVAKQGDFYVNLAKELKKTLCVLYKENAKLVVR